NRFYWLSTDGVRKQHLNDGPKYDSRVLGALLQGNIGKGNQITLRVNGVDQVSVWLGRNRRGEATVDFEQPLTVWINGGVRTTKRVAPSMTTLLEALSQRGDGQRLYLARLDFDKP